MAGTSFVWGNRSWGAGDRAAFARYLMAHGGTQYGAWAKNHPKAATLLSGSGGGGSKPRSVVDIATEQANNLIQPEIDAISAERQHSQESSQHLMENAKGIYAALAQMLGGVGPATANIYGNAVGEESAIGKGFAEGQGAIQDAQKSDLGSYLSKIGAPAEQVGQVMDKAGGTGAQDVVYGLGAAIPATELNREGAAFSAAAARLPAEAIGQGMEQIKMMVSDAMKGDLTYADQIAQLEQKKPGMIQDVVKQILDDQRAQEALRIQEAYLGLSGRKTDATLTGVDPATGQPTYQAQKDARTAKQKQAAARGKANQARENAFAGARQDIFKQTQHMVTPMTLDEQIAWVAAHPGKNIADAPKTHKPAYAAAKKQLFNQYKDLLRYATRAGRPVLKRRLNQMIDEALAAVGILPVKVPQKPATDMWSLAPGEHQG